MVLQQHFVKRIAEAEQPLQCKRTVMKLRVTVMPEIAVQVEPVFADEPDAELTQSFICRIPVLCHCIDLRRHRKGEPRPQPGPESLKIAYRLLIYLPVLIGIIIDQVKRIHTHKMRKMPVRFVQPLCSVQHNHAVPVNSNSVEL